MVHVRGGRVAVTASCVCATGMAPMSTASAGGRAKFASTVSCVRMPTARAVGTADTEFSEGVATAAAMTVFVLWMGGLGARSSC